MPSYTLIIDTHIHLYSQYDLSLLFMSAFENMSLYSRANDFTDDLLLVLGLTSTLSETTWQDLKEMQNNGVTIVGKGGEWRLSKTCDDTLLRVSNPAGDQIYLLCGCQLVTSEKLELLVLGTESPVYDASNGLLWHVEKNLAELMVVPWAVGKWLGRRGEIVSEAIDRFPELIQLGDNGGRPALWSHVKQFRQVAQSSIAIWPGTDPLPLQNQERRVGLNTIAIEGVNLPDLSGKEVVATLKEKGKPVMSQSRRESLINFLRNQISLRLQVS